MIYLGEGGFLKARAGVVFDIIVKGQEILNVGTDDIHDGIDVLGGLVVGLEGGTILEEHGEAVGEALGAGREVDSEVDRLDDGELVLQVSDLLEDVLGLLLRDGGLELEENDVCDGHDCLW